MRVLKAKKLNRAFTLAETMMAMAVILVISLCALTTTVYCIKLSKKASDENFFTRETYSFLQCYLYDDFATVSFSGENLSVTDFSESLRFYLGNTINVNLQSYSGDEDGKDDFYNVVPANSCKFTFYYNNDYTITSSLKGNYRMEITLYGDDGTNKSGFVAGAYYNESGKTIYKMEKVAHSVKSFGT